MRKFQRMIKSRDGFSILEAILALLLLAIVVVVFVSMVTISDNINKDTAENELVFYDDSNAICLSAPVR